MKLNSTFGQDVWTPVGYPGLSAGETVYPGIVLSPTTGLPYVFYSDSARGGKATVMRLRN